MRPILRPGGISQRGLPDAADLIAQANLGGRVGFAVADAQSGQMVETFFPLFALPPASVTKVLTGAYALDRLGRDFRFRTRFAALGAVNNGHLRGDLWLIGAGDPLFDTDALVRMVQNLRDGGIRTITGRLMIAHGALPQFFEIDSSQPDHVGYNPAISGLNLNFNRVHFEWRRTSSDYFVTMDARSDTIRPTVDMAQMHIANRVLPVYTYDQQGDQDHWTVARDALGEGGARWLPVRRPEVYAAQACRSILHSHGIAVQGLGYAPTAPVDSVTLTEHVSDPLPDILRGMLRWSTNLTAEVVGLRATQAGGVHPTMLAASATAMGAWAQNNLGPHQSVFVDHSGLSGESRVCPKDMVRALLAVGRNDSVRTLMRTLTIDPEDDAPSNAVPIEVVAKTGTLNFVSSLAGYIATPGGRDLVFAIFCADVPRRAVLTQAERERPEGGRTYTTRARRLQRALIRRWVSAYG